MFRLQIAGLKELVALTPQVSHFINAQGQLF